VDGAKQETDIFKLTPVARAFPVQIFLGVFFIVLGVGLALRAQDFSWPRWVPLVPLGAGVLLLLLLWIRVKSFSYRTTDQRLFIRRGWLAKHVNELELYRVKDVVVDQNVLQRLLGYGTITVLAADDTTPEARCRLADNYRLHFPGPSRRRGIQRAWRVPRPHTIQQLF
jgi:uncharacterized membrane protein YdbT with pleckstrin-like domain